MGLGSVLGLELWVLGFGFSVFGHSCGFSRTWVKDMGDAFRPASPRNASPRQREIHNSHRIIPLLHVNLICASLRLQVLAEALAKGLPNYDAFSGFRIPDLYDCSISPRSTETVRIHIGSTQSVSLQSSNPRRPVKVRSAKAVVQRAAGGTNKLLPMSLLCV